MIFGILFLTFFFPIFASSSNAVPYPAMPQPRRYRDLDTIIQKIIPDYDSRQYW